MNCDELRSGLVSYHFGAVSPEQREAIEEHLLACHACCRSFFLLKREIELAPAAPRPSSAARARLRAAVAKELTGRSRRDGWTANLMAFGFAAVTVGMAVWGMRAIAEREGALPHGISRLEAVR